MQEDVDLLMETIADLDLPDLQATLDSDQKKKTFWINAYNAYFQILRKDLNLNKPDIYRNRVVKIAGQKFSLDDIEHGILRKFRYKYSLGYLSNVFTKKLIKNLAVDTIDYRIHFALNCGAKSCPPIAFYRADKIETQLELASHSFLAQETKIDHQTKTILTTALFKWYLADFGGLTGIKKILSHHFERKLDSYSVGFNPYSWEEQLDNYIHE